MATPGERQKLAIQFSADVLRLQHSLEKAGHPASLSQVVRAWAMYSESLCATWLGVPDNEAQILDSLLPQLAIISDCVDEWRLMVDASQDESSDAIVRVPPEMLKALGWEIGDMLLASMTEDSALLVERSRR